MAGRHMLPMKQDALVDATPWSGARDVAPKRATPFAKGRDARDAQVRSVALIGTFPPRKCGIATFTRDVMNSLASGRAGLACEVIPVLREGEDAPGHAWTIRQQERESYAQTARRINDSDLDLVSIQHEFGIFGGDAGEYLLALTTRLIKPFVVTLHTVVEHPNPDQMRVICELGRSARSLIVMARKGAEMLQRIYRVDPAKIVIVPHGAPDRPFPDTEAMKGQFGWSGKSVALTFGLLSPGKGIETVIEALPHVLKRCPNVRYVVLGATHPDLVRREGERYRESLMEKAGALGVAHAVEFVDRYCETDDLLDYLSAADLYVTPYLNEAQITSGTLAYAIALGRPVVSTPYWHAQEAVTPEVGRLAPFGDAGAFAGHIADLMSDENVRLDCARMSYQQGRKTIWRESGRRYLEVFDDAAQDPSRPEVLQSHPERRPDFRAVRRMSDDCGMIQFASHAVPSRDSGYCIDDVARAYLLLQRAEASSETHEDWLRSQIDRYAAFLHHGWNDASQRFRNFMSYDRRWLDEAGSEDSNGRAFWALASGYKLTTEPGHRAWAHELLNRCAQGMLELASPRAQAFVILGAQAWRAGDKDAGVTMEMIQRFGTRLHKLLRETSRAGWTWFEDRLTYDNARLPQALLAAGKELGHVAMRADALEALTWLSKMQTSPKGHFRGVGNDFSLPAYSTPAVFDQQPIEAAASVETYLAAWKETGHVQWLFEAQRAHDWFFGGNDCGARLAADEGGCFDGLHPSGVNRNQGAESTLSLQLANLAMATI